MSVLNKVVTIVLVCTSINVFAQNIGINGTGSAPDPSAGLDVDFTNKGTLITRMTTSQRDAIPTNCSCTPVDGLMIFNTTVNCMQMYVQGTWYSIGCANCGDAPSISSHPVDASINNGENTSFTVTASGTGTLTYQWQESTDAGASWNNISNGGTNPAYANATTATLSLTNVPSSYNTYQYRCIVSGTCPPAANSNSATLTVSSCPTISDDFSSYTTQGAADAVWVPQDNAVARVNITNDDVDWQAVNDGSNDAIIFDLGAPLNDAAFVARFTLITISNNNAPLAPGTDRNQAAFGLYSAPGTTGYATGQDAIYLQLHIDRDGTDRTYFSESDGFQLDQLVSRVTDFTNTTYYVEIARTSTTSATMTIFSDPSFTTATLGTPVTITVPATVTGLRYFGYKNSMYNYGSSIVGAFDDVQICNGVTSWP